MNSSSKKASRSKETSPINRRTFFRFLDTEPLSLLSTAPKNVSFLIQQLEPIAHLYRYIVQDMIREGRHPVTLVYIYLVYWMLWYNINFVYLIPQLLLLGWAVKCFWNNRSRWIAFEFNTIFNWEFRKLLPDNKRRRASSYAGRGRKLSIKSSTSPITSSANSNNEAFPVKTIKQLISLSLTWSNIKRVLMSSLFFSFLFSCFGITRKDAAEDDHKPAVDDNNKEEQNKDEEELQYEGQDFFWSNGPGSLMKPEVIFPPHDSDAHSRINEEGDSLSAPNNIKSTGKSPSKSLLANVDVDAIFLLLQLGQNAVGLAGHALDSLYQILDVLDWTFPFLTMGRIIDVVLSIVPTVVLIRYFHFSRIFFVLGISPILVKLYLVIQEKFVKLRSWRKAWPTIVKYYFYDWCFGEIMSLAQLDASTHEDPPLTYHVVVPNVHGIPEILSFSFGGKKGETVKRSIWIFENQRWWLGLSWQPHLFTSERPLYSNEGGDLYCPPDEAFYDCRGWKALFIASDKSVNNEYREVHIGEEAFSEVFNNSDDKSGNHNHPRVIMDSRKISNLLVNEADGSLTITAYDWQYGDSDWSNINKHANPLSVVRRRRLRLDFELDWSNVTVSEVFYLKNLVQKCILPIAQESLIDHFKSKVKDQADKQEKKKKKKLRFSDAPQMIQVPNNEDNEEEAEEEQVQEKDNNQSPSTTESTSDDGKEKEDEVDEWFMRKRRQKAEASRF